MALIKCSECGKEISSSAEACPNCGCKTPFGRDKETRIQEDKEKREKDIAIIIVEFVPLIPLLIAFMSIMQLSQNELKAFWHYGYISDDLMKAFYLVIIWIGVQVGCSILKWRIKKSKNSE